MIEYYDRNLMEKKRYMNGSSWESEEGANRELDLLKRPQYRKRYPERIRFKVVPVKVRAVRSSKPL